MSQTTFATPRATSAQRRSLAEARLFGLRCGQCSVHDAGKALWAAKATNFPKSRSVDQLAKKVGKEIAVDGLLRQSDTSDAQLKMCEQVRALMLSAPITPIGSFSQVRKAQVERTDGFQLSESIVWTDIGEELGNRAFYSWDLTGNFYYTEDEIDLVGRPKLWVRAEHTDDGQLRIACDFSYGAVNGNTIQLLRLIGSPTGKLNYVFDPDTASQELLDNFKDFMQRAERIAHLL